MARSSKWRRRRRNQHRKGRYATLVSDKRKRMASDKKTQTKEAAESSAAPGATDIADCNIRPVQ